MDSANQILLQDARDYLLRRVTSMWTEAAGKERLLERAACFWLNIESLVPETMTLDGLCETTRKAAEEQHDYRPIAGLGLAMASLRAMQREIPAPVSEAFAKRVEWQMGCAIRLGESLQPFCYDSLALFGIAQGAMCLDGKVDEELATWFDVFLKEIYHRRNIAEWERALLSAISLTLPCKSRLPMPTAGACAETRLVLARHTALGQASSNDDGVQLLRNIKEDAPRSVSFVPAAFSLSAYEELVRSSPVSAPNIWTVEGVADLLRRSAKGLERWTWENKPLTSKRGAQARKWHVDHEYHVQNILWSVLAPIFPDLEGEFYTEPIGQKHPRADLGLRSLQVIVEAKFMRASDPPQKIIEEIAADVSFYRAQGSQWKHIVPFIWDDGRRTETHDTIRHGLAKLDGIVDTIIISRPGKMTEEPTP